MESKAEHDIARKLKVLNHAKEHGKISKPSVILELSVKCFTNGGVLMNRVGMVPLP